MVKRVVYGSGVGREKADVGLGGGGEWWCTVEVRWTVVNLKEGNG